ncbi:helix-turn-helix domain-containing protein [Paenibacillus lycopersici]|uniref:Helix-turn-helix domain-containing protein n=1 Tax=Paenibacillus lycopersici TaxID=2704462 RepID=A0A6C0FX92_9BACL|nr:helix-turn-helix domain-containing protein [Paenibacillus lycopersici]QHT58820.1 helix-turn-helix domain-containing protein [Paenibacillus lycopersici]
MLPYIYVWNGTNRIAGEELRGMPAAEENRYRLLIAVRGTGAIRAGGREYPLERGACIVLMPGCGWLASDPAETGLIVLATAFERMRMNVEAGPRARQDERQPSGAAASDDPAEGVPEDAAFDWEPAEGACFPKSFSRMEELVLALYDNGATAHGVRLYGKHALFQELIYLLMSEDAASGERRAVQAVERSIGLLRQSPSPDFTLAQLSETASLSPRRYSRIFRRLTGQSPIDYQNGLRIEQAKRLLATTDAAVHRIAHDIGFRDPFHFSRSFKRHTGVPPRLYARLSKADAKLVSLQYLGDMLALGIKPVGAPSQLLACRFYADRTEGIQVVGETVVTPDFDKLAAMKPDIIVTFDGHHAREYAQIAHTVDISWQLPFFDRFRLLADKVGKAEDAERWVERYMQHTAACKAQLKPQLEAGHTASLLWMQGLPATFQAYLDVGVLFRDLGMQAPPAIAAMRQKPNHPFKTDMPLDMLAACAGDHLFVAVSPDAESEREFRKLAASPQWQSLRAVREGRVYRLSSDWIREDPLSMIAQMDDAVRWMTQRPEAEAAASVY